MKVFEEAAWMEPDASEIDNLTFSPELRAAHDPRGWLESEEGLAWLASLRTQHRRRRWATARHGWFKDHPQADTRTRDVLAKAAARRAG